MRSLRYLANKSVVASWLSPSETVAAKAKPIVKALVGVEVTNDGESEIQVGVFLSLSSIIVIASLAFAT